MRAVGQVFWFKSAIAGLAAIALGLAASLCPSDAWAAESSADIAARSRPAVVSVIATSIRDGGMSGVDGEAQSPSDLPFRELKKDFPLADEQDQGRSWYPSTDAGSGFLIDATGYVMTSRHLVHDADRILVVLASGRYYPGVLVGMDAETDLALLKIDAEVPLPYLEWGNSLRARVGDPILLLGAPFGLAGTATRGIISARGTDLQRQGLDDYFQIDAAMNQGNSGGPLVNDEGRVIGVNAAILSPSGGSVGIGFAVPAVLARPVAEQLRARGRVDRVWLGVDVQPMTRPIADSLNMPEVLGALVAAVITKGPAARSGLRQGDVIVAIDGEPVGHIGDLSRMLLAVPAGTKLAVRVWRAEGLRTFSLVAEATRSMDSHPRAARLSWSHEDTLGLVLSPLTEDLRKTYELPAGTRGALVTNVMPGSTASYAGFESGDVIQSVSGTEVRDQADVTRQLWSVSERGRTAALFLVLRDGFPRFIAAYLPKGYSLVR